MIYNIRKVLADKNGFTLLETITASGLFILVSVMAINILIYSSNAAGRVITNKELLENARVAMDFIINNVQKAETVKLKKREDGTLESLTLTEYSKSEGGMHDYVFEYDSRLGVNEPRYHRLEFSGNELASYIRFISIDIENDIMTIKIITDSKAKNSKVEMKAITLTGSVSVKHKNLK